MAENHRVTRVQPAVPPALLRGRPGTAPGPLLYLGGLLMIGGGGILIEQYGLIANVDQLADLGKIAGYSGLAFAWYLAATGLLFAGYVLAIVSRVDRGPRDNWLVIGGISLLLLAGFALIYPATAIDVYLYAIRSRLWTDYGLNPSRARPGVFLGGDPWYRYITPQWAARLSPYGPLWNWIAAPGSLLDREHILSAVMYYKVIAIAAAVTGAWLLHALVAAIDRRFAMAAVIVWLWNPLLLWEGIANGHNDVVAILPLIAALWCWQTRRHALVVPLLTVSILIKYTALPLLPLAVIGVVRRAGNGRARIGTIALSALLTADITVISLAPFYDARALWHAFDEQRGVFVTSLPQLALRTSTTFDLGWTRGAISNVSTTGVVVAVLVACFIVWRSPDRFVTAGYAVMFVLLLLGTPNLRPWYILWLIPLAIAAGITGPWQRTLVWTTTALFSYAHYIWLREWWAPSSYWFEATGVALTIIPVLAMMAVEWRARDRPIRAVGEG